MQDSEEYCAFEDHRGKTRRQRRKSLLRKVGKRLGRKGNHKDDDSYGGNSVVEYSLDEYTKRSRFGIGFCQSREEDDDDDDDDDEVLQPYERVDHSCNSNGNETEDNVDSSFFHNPLGWMYSLASDAVGIEPNGNNDGYQADQERDQCSATNNDNEAVDCRESPEYSRAWRKQAFKGSYRRRRQREASETINNQSNNAPDAKSKTGKKMKKYMARSRELATRSTQTTVNSAKNVARSSGVVLSRTSRSFVRSASFASRSALQVATKSTQAISSGARTVTKSSGKIAKQSSRALAASAKKVSARSSRAVLEGARSSRKLAQRSSRALVDKASTTSKVLASSVQRMVEANQKKAASLLLASVHGMIQKSSQYKSPGELLTSIRTVIQETEAKAAKNRRLACRERRKVYKASLTDANRDADRQILIIPTISEDDEDDDERSFPDSHGEGRSEEKDRSGDDESDWDDDEYATTDWDNESGRSMYSTGDSFESFGSDTGDDCDTSGYFSSDLDVVRDDRGEYTEEEDDDEDDEDDYHNHLSETDRSIFHSIDNDLGQLEGLHEHEKSSWLYRCFFGDDDASS